MSAVRWGVPGVLLRRQITGTALIPHVAVAHSVAHACCSGGTHCEKLRYVHMYRVVTFLLLYSEEMFTAC